MNKLLLLLLLVAVVTVGCRESENGAYKHRPNQTNAVKPIKELTIEEKIVGVYELKDGSNIYKAEFFNSGEVAHYLNGEKTKEKYEWKIIDKELHVTDAVGNDTQIFKVNPDKSLTHFAEIDNDGKRTVHPKEDQTTAKKIK